MQNCIAWPQFTNDSASVNCSHYDGTIQDDCVTLQASVECLYNARAASVAVTAAALYLLLVTVVYEVRNRKRPDVRATSRLYLLSVFLCFLHSCAMLLHTYGSFLFEDCIMHDIVLDGTYIGSTLTVYTLFWVRQRRFYLDPLLRSSNTKCMRALSVFVIVGVYTTVPGLIIAFHSSHCMVLSDAGCVPLQQIHTSVYVIACSAAFLLLSLVFKALLLALIVMPLIQNGDTGWRECFQQCGRKQGADIRCLVRRLAVSMLACTLSTIVVGLAVSFMALNLICSVWELAGSLDLLAINVAAVCSFCDGTRRLCPVLSARKQCPPDGSKETSSPPQV